MPATLIDIPMPQMGESITEATITKWHRKPGEEIKRGETLLEISTAKVEAEIPSPHDGVLTEILHIEGETVPVDTVVARIGPPGSAAAAPAPKAAAPVAAVAAPPVTAKAAPVAPPASAPSVPSVPPVHSNGGGTPLDQERRRLLRQRSTPLVRNIAKELGIDVSQVRGTGTAGRVTRKDIVDFLEEQRKLEGSFGGPQPAAKPLGPVGAAASPGAMQFADGQDTRTEPLSVMRRAIAEHMVHSMRTSPHAYTVFEVDLTRTVKLRARVREEFESRFGVKLTPMAFIIKALAEALMANPVLNASLKDNNIVYHRHINIGIAVALPHGLIVPVMRNVEEKSLVGVARGLADIATRARSKSLQPSEVEGGTFTVTNPGQQGALMGMPIIAQPQAGIMHVGAVHKRPCVRESPDGEDTIVVRSCCYLTLGLDHRLIDGWAADTFMAAIRSRLENGDFRVFE